MATLMGDRGQLHPVLLFQSQWWAAPSIMLLLCLTSSPWKVHFEKPVGVCSVPAPMQLRSA